MINNKSNILEYIAPCWFFNVKKQSKLRLIGNKSNILGYIFTANVILNQTRQHDIKSTIHYFRLNTPFLFIMYIWDLYLSSWNFFMIIPFYLGVILVLLLPLLLVASLLLPLGLHRHVVRPIHRFYIWRSQSSTLYIYYSINLWWRCWNLLGTKETRFINGRITLAFFFTTWPF